MLIDIKLISFMRILPLNLNTNSYVNVNVNTNS